MTVASEVIARPNLSDQRPRRFSQAAALAGLYVLSIRQHVHGKRWMVMSLLFALPVILALIVRQTAHHVPPINMEFVFVFMFFPQALLPLGGLIYSSGIIQDEQEEQTITYLLMRPIAKWALYLVKLLASMTAAMVLTAVFTALAYVAIYAGRDVAVGSVVARCEKAIALHALAVGVYCCLFGLISLLTNRALVAGILYIAIVEGLFANLNFGIRLVSVIYYIRLITYHLLSFVSPMMVGSRDIAADAWQLDVSNDPQLGGYPSVRTCLIVLLSASVVFALLGAMICAGREFYVKTPEKGG